MLRRPGPARACLTTRIERAWAGRPRWGWLYGVTLPWLAGLAGVEAAGPAGLPRIALRVAMTHGAVTAMGIWIRANRAALDLQDWCDCASETVTVRVIPSRAIALPPRPPDVPLVRIQEYEVAGRR